MLREVFCNILEKKADSDKVPTISDHKALGTGTSLSAMGGRRRGILAQKRFQTLQSAAVLACIDRIKGEVHGPHIPRKRLDKAVPGT